MNKSKALSIFLFLPLLIIFLISNVICPNIVTASNDITASQFVSSMNTGWNLGNSLDVYYGNATGDGNLSLETRWENPKVTQEQISFVKSQGFDVIRIPVTWYVHTYTSSDGALHIHPDWLKRVREVVDYSINAGFYVIINTHHDDALFFTGVSDQQFSIVKNNAVAIWSDIASYFADYDSHLIFESFNEVNNLETGFSFGDKAASQMNELNQIFVDTVRSYGGYNNSRILMVPTLLDNSGSRFENAFKLPSDEATDKIIVTVHKYAQYYDQTMDAIFSDLQNFSKSVDAPIIIGEWGTQNNYTPADYRAIHASNFISRAKSHGIKCIYWDNGKEYAIIDRVNLTANTQIISAIMHPKEYVQPNDTNKITGWNNFLYMTPNMDTGELKEDSSWGMLVINSDGNGSCPIPSGKSTLCVNLLGINSMSEQAFHDVYFFDTNGNLTGKIKDWYGFTNKEIAIPTGSTRVRIVLCNAFLPTTKEEYKQAVDSGLLIPSVSFK